jgi:phage-related protein
VAGAAWPDAARLQAHAGSGRGAYEIRIKIGTQWRVIYVANRDDAVYVLHAFQKTSQMTAQKDIDLAALRYKLIGD